MRPRELVGFAEVVELLGVPRRTVARYVQRDDFPEPYVRLRAGPIWLRGDVEKWGKVNLPLRMGRPRKSR
jgi:predicted DNA-binding transcriptional regulator AlpA